ncbi:MAG: carboxypeptidase regulatory-like domain-containing protein [Nitrososphaerota archaeon]|nr:carboxypeptidase regulatory-like domain-containing protein [Nitrososphaerota archaeon]MDG6939367.1 carboxypeptidase regulatory-like domain-containing protein [Nitrososphaerota archaeon]
MSPRSGVSRAWTLLVVTLAIVGAASGAYLYVNLAGGRPVNPYIHTGRAGFALVSPGAVPLEDPAFVRMAEQTYAFEYADAANFSSVKSASFVVIVLGAPGYESLVAPYLNGSALSYASRSGGVTLSYPGVWSEGQTVFVLAGYGGAGLVAALDAFFVQRPVALPAQSFVNVTVANGTSVDPVLDANYAGYPLDPADRFLNTSPYSYYLNFASVFYRAPWSISYGESSVSPEGVKVEFAFNWSGSGPQLPHGSQMCFISERPGICWGVYAAVPVFSFVQGATQRPVIELDNADCSFFFVHCVGVKGTVVSGYSTTYGPGYLSGEKFWAQLLQQYSAPTNFTTIEQLMEAGVALYSTPLVGVPACDYPNCSSVINFTYGIYPLVTAYSNAEALDATFGARYNYTALFEPLTLSAPPLFTNSTGTYAFVQWTVYSEVGDNTYKQVFDSSNATFQVVGPTQAEAFYMPVGPQPQPGFLRGRVEFYHTYGSDITGLPIVGATVSVTQDGKVVARATSGVDGNYTLGTRLQPGCYNVTAFKRGYDLEPATNPVCIDGNTVADIYERYFFWYFGYGPAGLAQGITANRSVDLYFEAFWPDGAPVSNWPIVATVDSGHINFQSYTNASGVATFRWTGGPSPGDFNASFSAQGLGTRPLLYTMPVAVFNASYPLFQLGASVPAVSALSNSTVAIPVALSGCSLTHPQTGRYVFACDPFQPPAVTLSVAGLPGGATFTFSPNPAYRMSILDVTLGPNVAAGVYNLSLTESASPPGYFMPALANSTTFALNVTSCSGGPGEISGEVLNQDGNLPSQANVTVYRGGLEVYTTNTTSGLFSTGYILPPGTYNVTAHYLYGGKTFSEVVAVGPCGQSGVTLTPMAGLTVQALYNGTPAAFANLTLTYSNGLARQLKANGTGVYGSGYSLLPGTYSLTASFDGYNSTVSLTLSAGNTTYAVVSITDPPAAVPSSEAPGTGASVRFE